MIKLKDGREITDKTHEILKYVFGIGGIFCEVWVLDPRKIRCRFPENIELPNPKDLPYGGSRDSWGKGQLNFTVQSPDVIYPNLPDSGEYDLIKLFGSGTIMSEELKVPECDKWAKVCASARVIQDFWDWAKDQEEFMLSIKPCELTCSECVDGFLPDSENARTAYAHFRKEHWNVFDLHEFVRDYPEYKKDVCEHCMGEPLTMIPIRLQTLIYKFFDIDPIVLEEERRAILENHRNNTIGKV